MGSHEDQVEQGLLLLTHQGDRVIELLEKQNELLGEILRTEGIDITNLPVADVEDAVRVVVVGDERLSSES